MYKDSGATIKLNPTLDIFATYLFAERHHKECNPNETYHLWLTQSDPHNNALNQQKTRSSHLWRPSVFDSLFQVVSLTAIQS